VGYGNDDAELFALKQPIGVHAQFGANVFLTRSREEREDVSKPSPKRLPQAKARKIHHKLFLSRSSRLRGFA
jgi:hypothetical protein